MTGRMDTGWRGVAAAVAVAGLAACGSAAGSAGSAGTAGTTSPSAESAAAYRTLLGVLDEVKVATCEPAEAPGAGFIALPAPAAESAREYSWFRYLEGRIYEFGPCQLASGQRNELRIYRYPDTAARDAALRDIERRGTRPTSTFAFDQVVAVEIWSPEPSLDSPVGQLAQVVHSAIGALPQAWHLDVAGS